MSNTAEVVGGKIDPDPSNDTATEETEVVPWEHEFADGDRVVWLNTSASQLQFEAPGDVSEIKHDPNMRVDTLLSGETMISIEFEDDDLTVVGRFFPESDRFSATVRTPKAVYVLSDP